MKINLLIGCCLFSILCADAQRVPQVPDSIRRKYKVQQLEEREAERQALAQNNKPEVLDFSTYENDSLLRIKLVELAWAHNPNLQIANHNISAAQAQYKYAKKAWLSTIQAGANANEFVINNSPQANFFPKYNLGLNIPFDVFSRTKKEKKVTAENIAINQEMRTNELYAIRQETLTRYENYLQAREMLRLQQESVEYDLTANEAAKKAYADGEIKLEDMNKTYQVYLSEKSELVARKRDYNVAKIALEEYIGIHILDDK